MRALNNNELEQVSGGFGPLGGGILGGVTYTLGNAMSGGDFSSAEFAGAVTFGAVTSGFGSLGGALTGAAKTARNLYATSLGTVSGAAVNGVMSTMGGGGSGNTAATGSHILEKYK